MQTARLEQKIGHTFKDASLLVRALTHRSWAYENIADGDESRVHSTENESVEFLGDSVLGLAIAETLFKNNPGVSEGDLTLMKHRLVSTATLADIGESLGLGEYVRVGRGEEKTGGRKKRAFLANSVEAVIGAVFLDGGYVKARALVARLFAEQLKKVTPDNSIDHKTTLQELLQSRKMHAPTYHIVDTEGPPHARKFSVEALWETGKSHGSGDSIKEAEMQAAAKALEILKSSVESAKRTQ
ncbi:MAG: ribonuclease III [Acidobacteria bacterium]|nr:ribonuclease III [Acidobacteriota bacterium]